jgi:hypothetical protein
MPDAELPAFVTVRGGAGGVFNEVNGIGRKDFACVVRLFSPL